MATRRSININLSDEEYLALRQILLAEGTSVAEFFARRAREYIAEKRKPQPESGRRPRPHS